jgi:hypothetical protein
MKRQKGLSLISTLIVGMVLVSILILGFKVVPVYTEYFSAKQAFKGVLDSTDPTSPPTAYRRAVERFKDIGDMPSIDPSALAVTRDAGQTTLQISYRREVPVVANVGLYFDFDISVTK